MKDDDCIYQYNNAFLNKYPKDKIRIYKVSKLKDGNHHEISVWETSDDRMNEHFLNAKSRYFSFLDVRGRIMCKIDRDKYWRFSTTLKRHRPHPEWNTSSINNSTSESPPKKQNVNHPGRKVPSNVIISPPKKQSSSGKGILMLQKLQQKTIVPTKSMVDMSEHTFLTNIKNIIQNGVDPFHTMTIVEMMINYRQKLISLP